MPSSAVMKKGVGACQPHDEKSTGPCTSPFLAHCKVCPDPCCCGQIFAFPDEHRRIVEYSGVDHFQKGDGYYWLETDCCPYLSEQGLCSVYPVRPLICQLFPWHPDPEGPKVEVGEDTTCPALPHLPPDLKGRAAATIRRVFVGQKLRTYRSFWDS